MKTISLKKKVAAVAVASLGLGLLSVAPAKAAETAAGVISAINLKAATANTNVTGSNIDIYFGASKTAPGIADNDESTFAAALTSYPAGGFVSVTGVGSAATLSFTDTTSVDTASGSTVLIEHGTNAAADSANTVTATGTDGLGMFRFVPTVAGTYTVTVWHDAATLGSIQATEAQQSINIVVTAAPDLVPSASTAFMTTPGANGANASSSTNAIPRAGAATAGTHIAQVKVNLFKSDGTADNRNHTLTCEISGSGYCGFAAVNTDPNSTSRSATNSTGANDRYVGVEADGTAGVGTVSIFVTHLVTGVKSLIYTGTFTSYGDVAKLEISTRNYTIGRAGFTTGAPDANLAARTAAGNTKTALANDGTVPAFIVKMTDSGGRLANRGAVPTIVSSNAAVVTGGTCALDDGSAVATGDSSSTNGVGFYNCNFDTAASAKSGDKATLTLRVVDPADATLFLTTTLEVTVGGSIATEVISFDKAKYAPGEGMTLTLTAKDSSGNPVFDGATSPAITFSKAVGGTSPAASQYIKGVRSSTGSTGVQTVFAPAIGGSFSANATSGNASASAISATASVESPADAQIAALVAAIAKLQKAINKINKRLNR